MLERARLPRCFRAAALPPSSLLADMLSPTSLVLEAAPLLASALSASDAAAARCRLRLCTADAPEEAFAGVPAAGCPNVS